MTRPEGEQDPAKSLEDRARIVFGEAGMTGQIYGVIALARDCRIDVRNVAEQHANDRVTYSMLSHSSPLEWLTLDKAAREKAFASAAEGVKYAAANAFVTRIVNGVVSKVFLRANGELVASDVALDLDKSSLIPQRIGNELPFMFTAERAGLIDGLEDEAREIGMERVFSLLSDDTHPVLRYSRAIADKVMDLKIGNDGITAVGFLKTRVEGVEVMYAYLPEFPQAIMTLMINRPQGEGVQ